MSIRLSTPIACKSTLLGFQGIIYPAKPGVFHLKLGENQLPAGVLRVTQVKKVLWVKEITSHRPDFKGIGRALHEGAFRIADKQGITNISLQSRVQAIDFHEKCGYKLWPLQPIEAWTYMSLSKEAKRQWREMLPYLG